MNRFLFLFAGLTLTPMCLATRPDLKNLPIGLAPSELGLRVDSGAPKTAPPPPGEIRSLAEWEEAEAVMTLWPNSSLLSGLSKHGDVKLFADTRGDQDWWKNFLSSNGIAQEHFSYFVAPTDSIWIRDYGPWFILDGNRNFGIIDNKYNRPRPLDDVIPIFLSKELNIPYYQPGLVHTGGNYYNDGMGNAFSSTLVFEENPGISQDEVLKRMLDYLGITRYLTSPLAPHATSGSRDARCARAAS